MLTQNRCEQNDLGMQGMCGHKQIGIWEVSKITWPVVDSNDVVNHWLMTGAINIQHSHDSYQRPVLITPGLGRCRHSFRRS